MYQFVSKLGRVTHMYIYIHAVFTRQLNKFLKKKYVEKFSGHVD